MAKRKKIRKMKKDDMYLTSFLQLYLVSGSGRAPEETFREGSVQERLLVPDQHQHHTYHHDDHYCNGQVFNKYILKYFLTFQDSEAT